MQKKHVSILITIAGLSVTAVNSMNSVLSIEEGIAYFNNPGERHPRGIYGMNANDHENYANSILSIEDAAKSFCTEQDSSTNEISTEKNAHEDEMLGSEYNDTDISNSIIGLNVAVTGFSKTSKHKDMYESNKITGKNYPETKRSGKKARSRKETISTLRGEYRGIAKKKQGAFRRVQKACKNVASACKKINPILGLSAGIGLISIALGYWW